MKSLLLALLLFLLLATTASAVNNVSIFVYTDINGDGSPAAPDHGVANVKVCYGPDACGYTNESGILSLGPVKGLTTFTMTPPAGAQCLDPQSCARTLDVDSQVVPMIWFSIRYPVYLPVVTR